MRTEATRPPGAGTSASAEHATHAYAYFGQLENMKKHQAPPFTLVSAGKGKGATEEGGLSLKFNWSDAFRPREYHTQSSIDFEQANVLFNAAAHESMAAASCDRNSGDGLKTACKRFQHAAGNLQYCQDHLLGKLAQGAGSDLGGVEMLKHLMLAQAQACFYEKAVKDKRIAPGQVSGSPKPLAMLAAQAGWLYGEALRTRTAELKQTMVSLV